MWVGCGLGVRLSGFGFGCSLIVNTESVPLDHHLNASQTINAKSSSRDYPVFRASNRVAVKARKKASWMWKIESLLVTLTPYTKYEPEKFVQPCTLNNAPNIFWRMSCLNSL